MTTVQTELSEKEYERLRAVAEARNLSIREAVGEATRAWLENVDAVDPDDALFTTVPDLRTAADAEPQRALADEDDVVEEQDGLDDVASARRTE